MWDAIFQYLSANSPTILVILIACWVTWKLKGMYDRTKAVEKKVDTLPCEQHKSDILLVKQNNIKLDDISSSIRKIEEWILKMDINAMDDLVRKCSPYQLTEIGKIMLLKSEAKSCVDTNLEQLLQLIEKTKPKTAYDVERNSLRVLSSLIDDSMFNEIKNFIYNSPASIDVETSEGRKKVAIDMQRILMITSIYLRDKYFEMHREMDVSDFPLID